MQEDTDIQSSIDEDASSVNEQRGMIPSPSLLQLYKTIDQSLPAQILLAIDNQLKREFRYALGGQIVAGMALFLMAGGFIYLVMNGHERPAYVLLGAGVLNAIGGFLRARLGERRWQSEKSSSKAATNPEHS